MTIECADCISVITARFEALGAAAADDDAVFLRFPFRFSRGDAISLLLSPGSALECAHFSGSAGR